MIKSITDTHQPYDVVVIGGGATGLGIAVDAASRGYSTLLLERDDFAKGTSSRSTKLAHGGVRYLAQGNVRLVMEALRERGIMKQNAPALIRDLPFIVPAYRWWEIPFYLIGLKLYDLLSGKLSLGRSRFLSASSVIKQLPTIRKKNLKGGIVYYDGQFDDSRMAISLAKTTENLGGQILNYAEVTEIRKKPNHDVFSLTFRDHISGLDFPVTSKTIFNATGVFVDSVPGMDGSMPLIAPSRGAHIVVDRRYLKGSGGLMIPKTSDGRILFVIPWYGKALIGTTDAPVAEAVKEPVPSEKEILFILETAQTYLNPAPQEHDILSVFAGLRPLAAPRSSGKKTKEISRGHQILVMDDQMITIIGGKWTTYRRMAQDAIDEAIAIGRLPERPCRTDHLPIWISDIDRKYGLGAEHRVKPGKTDGERAANLLDGYPWTEDDVRYMIREEYAMTIEDILSRRMRILVLDAGMAIKLGPVIGDILEQELAAGTYNKSRDLNMFYELAKNYRWKRNEF